MIRVYVPHNRHIDNKDNFELLHPIEQVKEAKSIVKSGKNRKIITHSPLLIEALETYSNLYGRDIEFYLEGYKDEYPFGRVFPKDMKYIYRELGDPYDIIDEINGKLIAKRLKEEIL